NVATGAGSEQMALWQSKAAMKPLYAAAGVPTARQVMVADPDEVRAFVKEVGFPVFTKPEKGVGAGGARKIEDEAALEELLAANLDEPYVLEEFIDAELCSYEAILDANCEPLFENQSEFPPSIADTVKYQLDVAYYTRPTVDPKLRKLGRATAKAFGIRSRFVHMEFFRLTADKPGLGKKGDYVGLEVNVRAPGGYTPDMINFAHSADVYQIWADMVTTGTTTHGTNGDTYYCIYACRRDCHTYVHTHQEIMDTYGDVICMQGRMADVLSDDLGNDFYMARFKTVAERKRFEKFVQQQA
ncbi:MAG: ATP-grasp domain-containing protein, partial [Atopobiaceae bacterium]|nr:ATP-grasp domain-containing protein [Atopobiaceae bacterium]